jgi:cytoskeletal protein CcmA (bactofilin family)
MSFLLFIRKILSSAINSCNDTSKKGFFMTRRVLPVFILLLLIPSFVFAAEFKSGDSVSVDQDETINDDLYIGSGNISIDGTINGDLIAGGGTVTVKGTVTGDLIVGGGNVVLRGKVLDDVRLAGGQIDIDGTINDDLLVAGGMVTISRDATVSGQVKAAGGQIKIAGTTGDVETATDDLTIQSTAVINGDLRYWSEKDARIDDAAKITGSVDKQVVSYQRTDKYGNKNPFVTALISILVSALFAWLFSLAFPHKTETILASSGKEVGWNILTGFLTMIGIPVLSFFLFVSIIGIPAGLFIVLAYPLLLALGWLVTVLMAGYGLNYVVAKQKAATWVYALLGAAALTLIAIIPIIGWLIKCLIFAAGFGGLVRFSWDKYQKLRHSNEI